MADAIDDRDGVFSQSGGSVLLRGGLHRRSEVEMLQHLVAGLDGVVSVDSQLRYEFDDTHVKPATEAHVA